MKPSAPCSGGTEALAPLPALAALSAAEQSELYRLCPEPAAAASGFGPQSLPYLWASEFPTAPLRQLAARLKPPVVCVAGSGDNAIELLRLGLWPLLAVDVSRQACYVNELKAAALTCGLGRQEYLQLLPAPPPGALKRLGSRLSREAAAYWRQALKCGGPESASLLAARPHLPGLAYLATDESFAQARAAARRWPLLNTSLECCLARAPEPFGTIYAANVAEYIRRELLLADRDAEIAARLLEFYRRLSASLLPGGMALAYVFEAPERAGRGHEAEAMAAAGLEPRPLGVEFQWFGTTFRHCLLAGRRP